jgi:hypothetical protein
MISPKEIRHHKNISSRKMPSSGMWRREDLVLTDVSEERIASIFRAEKFASEEPALEVDAD